MSVRGTRGSSRAGATVVLIASIALSACGNHARVEHGVRISPDGNYIIATGREPSCGCMMMKNRGKKEQLIKASLFGVETGEQILQPDALLRVQFDWAGPENSDFYQIAVFDTVEGRQTKDLTKGSQDAWDKGHLSRIKDYLDISSAADIEVPCNETCEFGSLGMNRVYNAHLRQGGVETHEPGVHVRKNGHVIEAAASSSEQRAMCGCVLLRNISEHDVTLESTLHGIELGRMTIPKRQQRAIAFDDAGGRPNDVYTIAAVSVDAMAPTGGAGVAGQSSNGPGALRIADYLRVIGQLDLMECVVTGPHPAATFKLLADEDFQQTIQSLNLQSAVSDQLLRPAVADRLKSVTCPFDSLGDGTLGMSTKVKALASGKPASNSGPPSTGTGR